MSRKTGAGISAAVGAFRYPGEELRAHWGRLHHGDREPFPDPKQLGRLAKRHPAFGAWAQTQGGTEHLAERLQDAWRDFHAGDFARAIEIGSRMGALGAAIASKAAAIHVSTLPRDASRALKLLQGAADRGEDAIRQLPEHANGHYTLALVLGRYSQRTSILTALAEGVGSRVRVLLERTLELEPRHAEAHVAFGLYHAEIVGQLGGLVGGLTYGVSEKGALEHFRAALKLAPESPIAHMELAHGLLLLDARANRAQALEHYERAAACEPADAMERLDVERARRGLA